MSEDQSASAQSTVAAVQISPVVITASVAAPVAPVVVTPVAATVVPTTPTPAPVAPVVAPITAPVTATPVTPVTTTPVAPVVDHYFARLDYLISNYVTNMAPGRMMTAQDGANLQRSLLDTFRHVLGADPTKAKQAFEILFSTINKYRDTVFAETNVYRYFSVVKSKLAPVEFELFSQLVHLFINASNPSTREVVMKQIDINKLAKNLDSNKQFMNLAAYFGNRF